MVCNLIQHLHTLGTGEARHGGHQARAGHGAASERGDRRAAGVRRPAGGALTTEEVTAT